MAPRTVKKTLAGGKGSLPGCRDNDKAIFDYEVLIPLVDVNKEGFPDNKDLYKTVDTTKKPYPHGYGRPLELVFGKKFQMPIMETCLKTMLVEEIAQFDIDVKDALPFPMISSKLRDISKAEVNKDFKEEHHHHCAAMGPIKTGYPELDELIADPKPLRLIIHLKQVLSENEYKADSWQLDDEAKMKAIVNLKAEGNELFKNKKYEEAIEKYREALTMIDVLLLKEKPGDTEWKELDEKNIPFYLNLSQCYLCVGKYYEAVGAAEEALKRDGNNAKALFRRAKGRIGTWDLENAEKDLRILAELHPESKNLAQNELNLITKKREEKKNSDKNVMIVRKMFVLYLIIGLIQISSQAPPVQRIEVARPDHLEGVPLERDGSLNHEFRQEIVFGKDESSAKAMTSNDPAGLEIAIREMFKKADKDSNGLLTKEELKNQIIENTNKHMEEGKKEADAAFQEVDSDGDGKVTWEEYQKKFLVEKNLVDKDHINEHEEHSFDADARRLIDEEKLTFEGADADGDGLDNIEWLGFQHPEHSKVMLKEMAEDIMRAYDENRDGVLSKGEFTQDAPGESTDPEMDLMYKVQRGNEFDTDIDVNKDGKATLEELLDYVNPKNERNANQEVTEIMDMVDSDRDEKLSLAELLNNAEALANSGFVKAKKRLHDDL
ncbi:hypothetical protein FO519_003769 [Halicephalobus sp. NKZ332]|nr:hypothetical protein FO519_003769 [Halicephalobus sp. NKZ332]